MYFFGEKASQSLDFCGSHAIMDAEQGEERSTVLQGFRPFNFSEGVPYVSITSNGVTFNKSTVMKLGYPEYVQLLIDEDGKRIAVQVCDAETPNAASFFKPNKSNTISVRWNGRDLLNTLADMMGWDLHLLGYRADGIFLKDEGAVLFDLKRATSLT